MKIKKWLIFVFLFLSAMLTPGQDSPKVDNLKPATKIDEFGDVGEREFSPKLESFFEILRKDNSQQGFVIFYNSFNDTSFKQTSYFAQSKMHSYSKYLTCTCRDASRITYVQGGLQEKMRTELWIMTAGGKQPPVGKSVDFRADEKYQLETLGVREFNLSEARLIEQEIRGERSAALDFGFDKYPKKEDLLKETARVLSQDKSWRAVLFFYADKDDYEIKKSLQIIEDKLNPFSKTYKIEAKRIKIAFGGYREFPQIESWIIPANGIEPEAVPNEKTEEN